MTTITWTWECLADGCDATGTGHDNVEVMAGYEAHRAQAHPDAAGRVRIGNDVPVESELERERKARCSEVLGALASTDKWAARAYEDGVPISDARKLYRQNLRAVYRQLLTSDDPASVEFQTPPA